MSGLQPDRKQIHSPGRLSASKHADYCKNVANYKWYSSLDLRSAYHQVPLLPEEKEISAFEANGRLYQFKRKPFGLKNAVACFQRVIDVIRIATGRRQL